MMLSTAARTTQCTHHALADRRITWEPQGIARGNHLFTQLKPRGVSQFRWLKPAIIIMPVTQIPAAIFICGAEVWAWALNSSLLT